MPLNVMEWSVSASRDALAAAAGPLIRSSPVSTIDASARMSTALLAEPATGVMPSSAERVSCLSERSSSPPRTAAMALSASMPETSMLSCCANADTRESSSARAPSKPCESSVVSTSSCVSGGSVSIVALSASMSSAMTLVMISARVSAGTPWSTLSSCVASSMPWRAPSTVSVATVSAGMPVSVAAN